MTNQEVKRSLLKAINELMPATDVAAELAARSGYSRQYVYGWMNKKKMIHVQIQAKAMELLADLRAEAAAQLETIKTT
jgi:hypothetical protein